MIKWTEPGCLDQPMSNAGVTIGVLSERSGVSRSQLQRINNGMSPRFATLRAIEAALRGQHTPAKPRAAQTAAAA